jgi:hypothetical protein
MQLNDRVLINCSNQAANGIYIITQLESPITFVRSVDSNGSPLGEFQQGGLFYVVNGTVYGGSLFVQTSASPTIIGTSPIIYLLAICASSNSNTNISAGANITITGNEVALTSSLKNIISISGLTPPVNVDDAVNKTYADTQDLTKLSLSGVLPMTGALNMGTKLINNLATPIAAADAATKSYVDTTTAGYVPLSGGTLTNAALAGASSTITGTLTCSGAGKITGVPTPSAASDAVPKSYADLLVAGLTFKPAVACYTTLSAPLNTFVYNGGQQITISLAATSIDGYTLQLNDRVLVNCAGTQAANGVYLVTQLESPITLVRPADLDGSPLSEFQQGGLFYITNGAVYGGSLFVQSSMSPSIIGTSPIVYSQYSAAKNIVAGANIAITGNSVAVTPALTGITGVGLSAGDGTTGVVTVGKASGAESYALALPAAAPSANTYLQYTGSSYTWSAAGSPLTGGSNINITSNAVGLNAAVSGLTSVGINGTSSADVVTLSKATGGAAYTLALPAAAPAANTYLQYTGSSYEWGSGNNSAAVYLFATSNPDQTPSGSVYNIKFPTVLLSSGITATSPTTFSLPAGGTYRLSGCVTLSDNMSYQFYVNGLPIGEGAQNKGSAGGMSGTIALAYLTPTITTTVSLAVYGGGGNLSGNTGTGGRGPWIEILQISNNNTITAFTGATSTADGFIGYIPKPLAGDQTKFLCGNGSWAASTGGGAVAAQYCMMLITQLANATITLNTNIKFDFIQESSGLSFTMPANTFAIQPPYRYKLSAQLPGGNNDTRTSWYNVTTGAYIGAPATSTAGWASSVAVAYITCTVATTIALRCFWGGNTEAEMANANVQSYGWATIEVVSDNTAISQFTGATSSADGAIGYIPKPLAGQQNYVLTGSGTWQAMPTGVTGTIFQSVLNTKQSFSPGAGWATVPNLAINVTPPSITTKYLLSANLLVGNLTSTIAFRFMRGSTIIGVGSGNTNQGSFRVGNDTPTDHTKNAIGTYLDSPATTSNIIYTLQALAYDSSRGCYFNNLNTENLNVDDTCCISTLTAQQC